MNSIQDSAYRVPSVIERLHYHKRDQEKARHHALFLVVVGAVLLWVGWLALRPAMWPSHKLIVFSVAGDTGQLAGHVLVPSTSRTQPMLPARFPSGYVGKVRVLREMTAAYPAIDKFKGPTSVSLEPDFDGKTPSSSPANYLFSSAAGDDWGLPGRSPLWLHALSPRRHRNQPEGIAAMSIGTPAPSTPPHAQLISPAWPQDIRFLNDTVIVYGIVTLHSHGLISFELTWESHPELGFAKEVRRALSRSTCYPAVDKNGDRITIRCPYRCVFIRDAKSSVSVDWISESGPSPYDGHMTATIRK